MTRQRFLTLAVLAVAFATRVFRLDGQSLWGDEAISVSRATESLLSITQTAPHEGTLPPLYYYLLHFWQPMVGTTEFAVRYLSLLFGVLTVAVLYAAVRTSSGHRPAVLASALASISPFWVYYSQETRMYALATLLSLSSTWIFLRIVQRPRRAITPSIWMGYVLVSSLAVFSHYFAGFVLLAQNVVAGARLAGDAATVIRFAPHEPGALRRKLHLVVPWSLSQIGILLLLTPWVIYARQSLSVAAGAVDRAAIPLADISRHLLITFSLGTSVEESSGLLLSCIFLAVAGLGVVRQPRHASIWLALLFIPVLAIYYVSFTPHQGWARYFMVASPAWLALVTLGVDSLLPEPSLASIPWTGRAVRSLRTLAFGSVLLALALACALSLRGYYTDPRYGRYDWRGTIARMEAASLPSAAVVVNGPPWLPEFDYYFHSSLARGSLARYDLPRPGLQAWPQIEQELQSAVATHTGIWLVKYYPPEYDPDGNVEGWLAQHAFRASGEWVENATFSFYSLPQPGTTITAPVSATFGNSILLRQVRVTRVPAKNGALLQVTLDWQATQPISDDLTVFVHVVDETGRLVSQRDSPPMSGFRPTSGWEKGEVIEDRLGVSVPGTATEQPLRLRVGLYQPATATRLTTTEGPTQSKGDFVEVPAP